MLEKFRDIQGYEGLYQVSTWGRVYNILANKMVHTEVTKKGYLRVDLFKNGARKHHKVHRLVAEAFIPNPAKKPQVNHINGVKTDNFVENLEWCTNRENVVHAYKNGLNKAAKTIVQFDLEGNFIKRWINTGEITRELGIGKTTILAACKRKNHAAKGYLWKFE